MTHHLTYVEKRRIDKLQGKQDKPVKKDKGLPVLLKIAEGVVNTYIRLRDKDKGCITSGKPIDDAGHYIAVSENSALRFNEDNIHGQSAEDNRLEYGKRKEYRIALIKRIGLERVLELESTSKFHKWTREELLSIIKTYKEKIKTLK